MVSDYCGREFRVFADRVDAHEREFRRRPPAVLPIRWIPCDRVPEALTGFQHKNFPAGAVYAQDGLLTLKQRRRHHDEYQDFVDALAKHIVQTDRDHTLLRPARGPCSSKVTSAFGPPAGRRRRRGTPRRRRSGRPAPGTCASCWSPAAPPSWPAAGPAPRSATARLARDMAAVPARAGGADRQLGRAVATTKSYG